MTEEQTDGALPAVNAPGVRKSSFRRFAPLALLVAAIGAAYASGLHHWLGFEQLAANREAVTGFVRENFWLSVLAFGLLYVVIVALSLPVGSFFTVLGGFLFGPVIGGTTTVVAATLGALLIFFVAKTSFGESLAQRAGVWIEKLRGGFRDHALNYMLFLRLVPLFPFWLVNIAPALLGVRTSTYVIGTIIGIIPATYAFSWVGAGLGSVIDAQGHAFDACVSNNVAQGVSPTNLHCSISLDVSDLVTPELMIALAALGLVALIPVALQKLRKS